MTSKTIYRQTFAEIHLGNLRHNLRVLRGLMSSARFLCPMVKSNAYGHGDVEVARVLVEEGVNHMGIALIEEGVRLRQSGVHEPELLVFGCFDKDGAEVMVQHRLTPVLSLHRQLRHLEQILPEDADYPVHIKFNTGMARLGFEADDVDELVTYFQSQKRLRLAGICTHLSDGEDAGERDGRTDQQLTLFAELYKQFPDWQKLHLHALNSAGLISSFLEDRNGSLYEIGARPGIALYGILPDLNLSSDEAIQRLAKFDLRPVMTLKAQAVIYHRVRPGQRVSYGGKWEAHRDSVVAVVPIGYADGYPRILSNRATMLFKGQRVPVTGTVCMDYTMIDVTEAVQGTAYEPGEEVVLFGQQQSENLLAGEVAAWAQTIPYELITCIGRRVPRRYLE